jgi:hypothetical protein
VVDAIVVLWVAGWIAMGLGVSHDVANLSQLADTVVTSGRSVRQTGQALRGLEDLPFVGSVVKPRVERVIAQIDAGASQAIASGESAKESVHSLSVLLGVSVALIPSVPILALYVPFRISRMREVAAVRRAARRHGGEPAFEEFLARRAVDRLPFHRLRAISENPWRDLELGSHRALADAELARLGIRRAR